MLTGGIRTSLLDDFKPYLHDRLAAGARNVTALHAEIAAQGYTGSYAVLNRYLLPFRRAHREQMRAMLQRPRTPTVQQVTGWITGLPGRLNSNDADRLQQIRSRCPELDAAVPTRRSFCPNDQGSLRRQASPHRVD
jgi:hypothetical protein